MALLTIVVGVVGDIHDMDALVQKARRDLRNVVNIRRSAQRTWEAFEFLGWLEVDAVHSDDVQHLLLDRRVLLSALGAGVGIDGPVWIATLHAVVRHSRIDWQEVLSAFAAQWPLPAQVDVQPFREHLLPGQNLANCVNYALKHQAVTKVGLQSEPWPRVWMATFYTWLHEWSPSFKRSRFMMKRRVAAKTKLENKVLDITDDDAMPWLVI